MSCVNSYFKKNTSRKVVVNAPCFNYISLVFTLSGVLAIQPALAEDYFNPLALELNQTDANIDTELFSKQGGQLPGSYLVDIYVNSNKVDTRQVNFVETEETLQPELTPQQLADMGVKVNAFPELQRLPPDKPVSNISDYIPGVVSKFDFSAQRLDINIPQAALTSEARGYVNPALWDQGLPALMLNYNFSGSSQWQANQGGREDYRYLNLRSGANFGEWRIRNYSTWNSAGGRSEWQNISSYLQRDIQSLKAQFTLGDSTTPGEIFDSLQYQGLQLTSDDNMYPDSLKGFAPVVRGIARSNARVTIKQNGYIIYQTYVPAGPFEINDLYPTAASGELEVIISEADGSERKQIQPFSAVPVMLREGRLKYSATAGKYKTSTPGAITPSFGQGTLIYGLPFDVTLYGGGLFASNYYSVAAGVGRGFGNFGSISMDITKAKTRFQDSQEANGQSLRFQYGKNFEATATTVTLAGYRYSTSGFYDFREANETDARNKAFTGVGNNKRSRMQLNINQSLGDYGSVYFSAYQQSFWGNNKYERNISTGYNFNYHSIAYGVNYTLNQIPGTHQQDRQFAFTVQVPLGKWLPNSWANYGLTSSRNGSSRHEVGLSGTLLENKNLNYSVQQSYENRGVGGNSSLGADYRSHWGQVRGGYNYTNDYRQINYGLAGAVVAHPYGVTLSQPLGESMILVRAPGASDVNIINHTGVSTDARGYAVVPYASSYRLNRIALDTETLPEQIDITETVLNRAPTKGALVLADFRTQKGNRILVTLSRRGNVVPFGATATLVQSQDGYENIGIVGQDGQLYMSGVPDSGQIDITWGRRTDQQCRVSFTLPASEKNLSVHEFNAECR
ncbi:TPA: fimbria/pilus outer membrane usher protein [Enterobacter cloacae]